ncbi:MAG: hypothetical protein ACRD2E_11800 [Terriglobales bacterium]
MALKDGDVYRCTDPNCDCEVTVTRGAAHAESGEDKNPRCCCDAEMRRVAEPQRHAG